jgi:hypothetical protein
MLELDHQTWGDHLACGCCLQFAGTFFQGQRSHPLSKIVWRLCTVAFEQFTADETMKTRGRDTKPVYPADEKTPKSSRAYACPR